MCPSILTRQAAATTTPLFPAASDLCSREKNEAEFHHLHMAWELAADRSSRPLMHWLVD